MTNQMLSPLRTAVLFLACAGTAAGAWVYLAESPTLAQDEATAPDSSGKAGSSKRTKHRAAHKAKGNDASGAAPDAAAHGTEKPAAIDFAAGLDKAGATACHSQVNALATSTMGSVEKYNTVSNWSQVDGEKRAVSLAIGQKFANGSAVPFGVSQVISAPNSQGSCDGFTIQVFPSPLSCTKLRDSMKAQRGQQIGDLAGIPLMQDAAGRTMLVPTAADTCVLVATKTFYAK